MTNKAFELHHELTQISRELVLSLETRKAIFTLVMDTRLNDEYYRAKMLEYKISAICAEQEMFAGAQLAAWDIQRNPDLGE